MDAKKLRDNLKTYLLIIIRAILDEDDFKIVREYAELLFLTSAYLSGLMEEWDESKMFLKLSTKVKHMSKKKLYKKLFYYVLGITESYIILDDKLTA